jgi:hypothetical protein
MYAVYQEGFAIYGVGHTRDDAIADAVEWLADGVDSLEGDLKELSYGNIVQGDMVIGECTPELYELVKNTGGDCNYTTVGRIVDIEEE